ncbi:sorbosone dehydrogenase family protein [bacterium]|nr:MAG: sorbosone dehydrogenase family protein [bacterium]
MKSFALPALALLAVFASAQDRYTRRVEVVGHVNEPDKLAPTPARLANVKLPEGFRLTKFAAIQNPRWMVVNTDGTVYVSSRDGGVVYMFRDTDDDGVADVQSVVFKRAESHGLAIHKGSLYVVTVKEIYRAPILKDGTLGAPRLLRSDLPNAGQHRNRTIEFGPDGMMYVSVGSQTNEAVEDDRRNATIMRFDENAQNGEIYASGLRNTIGFGWHPVSGRMFGMDHGIDWLGDDSQREEFNEILRGKRYGWPYLYENDQQNPHAEPPADYSIERLKEESQAPLLTYTAHAAPMAGLFYTGSMFPAEYRNDQFRVMRGSWNRLPASGYEIVRVRFDAAGQPQGIDPFLTGFLQAADGTSSNTADNKVEAHIGRLCGIGQAKDGSLLFTDDTNNIIYRISYGQETPATLEDQDDLIYEKAGNVAALEVKSESFSARTSRRSSAGARVPPERSRSRS